jgi:hypothetical protein
MTRLLCLAALAAAVSGFASTARADDQIPVATAIYQSSDAAPVQQVNWNYGYGYPRYGYYGYRYPAYRYYPSYAYRSPYYPQYYSYRYGYPRYGYYSPYSSYGYGYGPRYTYGYRPGVSLNFRF